MCSLFVTKAPIVLHQLPILLKIKNKQTAFVTWLCNVAVVVSASQVSLTIFTLDDLFRGGENSFKRASKLHCI